MELYWEDAEEISEKLIAKFPNVDPLSIRFTDLHKWICELSEFKDDPNKVSEGKLEAIQMAWYELKKEG